MTPVSIEEVLPEIALAVSLGLREITNQFFNCYFLKQIYFISWPSNHAKPWGASSAPGGCSSQHRTLHSAGSPGEEPSPGKGQGMWAPMLKAFSPKLTDQFFHSLRCLPENGYLLRYHLVCKRNKRAPKVRTSLPQPACLGVLCAFSETLC